MATWLLAQRGRGLSTTEYLQAAVWLQGYTRRVASWWDAGFDLLLTPTIAHPPQHLGEFAPRPDNPLHPLLRTVPIIVFTSPFNATGQPAISLPLYWSLDGLPIGIQLVAAYGREDVLIRIAAQLERARPWADRRPVVSARG